jgi:hypothetical protein
MKLSIVCPQCMQDDLPNAARFSGVEFRDDGLYETTCPKGHKAITLLQQQKFEILFDIGAYALTDGYYREAVSSFTSSIERFYEFFIKAVHYNKKQTADVVSHAWKHVSNQSERQLGAFIFLYLSEFGHSPRLLSNSNTELRNAVIHKGKIPSRVEAIAYGQAVLDVVRPILVETQKALFEGVQQTIIQHLISTRSKAGEGLAVTTLSIPTILSLAVSESGHGERNLERVLAELRRW